ncbi:MULTISPECIES: hypothetical protein [Kosakonia]|uniref:Uncharacterized protein n=1 Tax=Kosakonia sacchari TaxID=1158459 RepID=A0ABZ0MKF9_9ENTR|nr:hypothetical protein [Kosakonia sacchari]WOZ75860.1 hypothetical protein Q8Y70_14720 [Kosakonia sacchari]
MTSQACGIKDQQVQFCQHAVSKAVTLCMQQTGFLVNRQIPLIPL